MMKEGYAGAQQMAGGVFSTLGWEINRENSIPADVWQEIVEVYLRDKKNLNIREWFEAKNPYAFQSIAERLLEATRKEYWKPDAATLREIAVAYAESVVRHGHREAGESNEKLDALLARTLTAPGPNPQMSQSLLSQYQQKSAAEKAAPKAAATEQVTGNKLAQEQKPAQTQRRPALFPLLLIGALILIFAIGFWKKLGVSRHD